MAAQKRCLLRLIKTLKRNPKEEAQWAQVNDIDSFQERVELQSKPARHTNAKQRRNALMHEIEAATGPLYIDLLRRYPLLYRKPFYFMSEVDVSASNEANPLLLFWDDGRPRKTTNKERLASLMKLIETPELGLLAVPNSRMLLETVALLTKIRNMMKLPLETELRVQRACESREASDTFRELWPDLDVISVAESHHSDDEVLQALFAHAKVESRGMMSTQGVVCISFDRTFPLAVDSHFYEFECIESKKVLTLKDVEVGQEYEVIVSHAEALRTRTGLFLRCDGHLLAAPTFVRATRRGALWSQPNSKTRGAKTRGAKRRPVGPRFETLSFSTEAYA